MGQPWTDWDDRTRMRIIAFHLHWFLFDRNGRPDVIKRRKVLRGTKPGEDGCEPAYECEEEHCDLASDDASMTVDARQALTLAWTEYESWSKANKK